MRIHLAFFQTQAAGPAAANYGFWAETVRAGLEEQGHTVLESAATDWAEGMSFDEPAERRAWRDRTWSRTLRELQDEQDRGGVDLFLGYFFPQQIEPSAVSEIRRRGIATVNFFCDNVREFRSIPEVYRPFDLHWVPEAQALPLYRKAGLPHLHAPMPAWIPPALRTPSPREEPFASFIGSRDPLRARLFGELAQLGGSIRIFGKGWRSAPAPVHAGVRPQLWSRVRAQRRFIHQHGIAPWLRKFGPQKTGPVVEPPAAWIGETLDRDGYIRVTRESRVTLGVNRYDSPRLRPGAIAVYSRLRDIEAPMLGGCYLTEWTDDLPELYALGEEIETYRTPGELGEKLRALEQAPLHRAELRRRGQARALRDHTVGRTIEKICRQLSLT